MRDFCLAALSSSLFYWFNIVNSDCRNLNRREIVSFPVPRVIPLDEAQLVSRMVRDLMKDYQENSSMRTVNYKGVGEVTVQYFKLSAF